MSVGILFINLGTPDSADPPAVRRYLKQFLSDRRVVEIPQILWQPILRGLVLPFRLRKSAHAYQKVWMPEGSPLAVFTARIATAFQARLGKDVTVRWAMRYGRPTIAERLDELIAAGCDRILIAPLYPQYCAATTAAALDGVYAALLPKRVQPAIRTLPAYPEDPAYIGALKISVERQLAALNFVPERLVASFHGMPERTRSLGDPYHDHCQATASALTLALGRDVIISFQSRFGWATWLEPATEPLLVQLAREGVNKVAVVAPGFAADCLETLEELVLRGRDAFLGAGGTYFGYLTCLNDSDEAIDQYQVLLGRELSGWAAL